MKSQTFCSSCDTTFDKELFLFSFCPVCKLDVKYLEEVKE